MSMFPLADPCSMPKKIFFCFNNSMSAKQPWENCLEECCLGDCDSGPVQYLPCPVLKSCVSVDHLKCGHWAQRSKFQNFN